MNIKSIMVSSTIILLLVACGRAAPPVLDSQPSTPSLEPLEEQSPLSPPRTPTPGPPELTSPLPNPSSSPIEPPTGGRDQAVAAAKARLAEELGVALDDIDVTAVQAVQWSDASLGCPKPGYVYAQVITPGYRMILEVQGEKHEVHTDKEGRSVVICDKGR